MNTHRPLLQSVVFAQLRYATGVNARDTSSAKVDWDAVRLLMVQRTRKPSRLVVSVAVVIFAFPPFFVSLRAPSTSSIEFVHRIDHRDDVFNRRPRLHVVNRN